jgi:hypothetical protein
MSKRPSETHSFDVPIATAIGIDKAIILKEIAGWCRVNEKKQQNIFFDCAWTYNPARAYALHFPYMGEKKVERLMLELEKSGCIFGAKFHTKRGNQTKSHCVNWELYNLMLETSEYCPETGRRWADEMHQKTGAAFLKNEESPFLKNEESSFPKNEESSFLKNEESYTPRTTTITTPRTDEPNGSNTLFPKPEKLKRKKAPSTKTLFKTTFPEDGGFEKFCAAFQTSEYTQNFDASLRYYFEAVRDWSAANDVKKADWIATARNFMRGDLAKNKLVTNAKLTNQHRPAGGVDFDLARRAASEFLAKRGIQA